MRRFTFSQLLAVMLITVLVIIVILVYVYRGTTPSPRFTPNPNPSPTENNPSPSPVAADPCHVGSVIYCALNPNVTQGTISTTICVAGWTSTVRPPTGYTTPLKASQLALYASLHQGDKMWTMAGTEEDHRVPLEGGGSPGDPTNLSPEDHPGSYTKDTAENQMKADICSGRKTLLQAQTEFITKFLAAYPGYNQVP